MSGYDAIIIGAGHNGLTAAALLAKRGRKAMVLERRDVVGGLAASEEFHPGFRTPGVLHDTSCVRVDVVDALDLGRHGLELAPTPASVLAPQSDGAALRLHYDPAEAASEIGRMSPGDADRYREFRAFIARVRDVVGEFFDKLPPDLTRRRLRDLWETLNRGLAARRLGRRDMMELARIPPMSVADWLDEWFQSDSLKATVAGPAVYGTLTGPRSPGSAFNLLLYECHRRVWVRGGPAALVAALEKCARSKGADIRTGSAVERIDVASGEVTGVTVRGGETLTAPIVLASCHPAHTFLDLAPEISDRLRQRIGHWRSRGTSAKVNVALKRRIRWNGADADSAEYVRIARDLVEMERAFDAVKYGRASERPLLDVYAPANDGFAPAGKGVLSVLAHYVPYDSSEEGEPRNRVANAVVEVLSRHSPDLPDAIEAVQVLLPRDLEREYGLVGGNIHHGEHAIDQLLVRPAPECARYATPIAGLYLCGSGSHPGGGVTCAPGRLAAQVVLGQ